MHIHSTFHRHSDAGPGRGDPPPTRSLQVGLAESERGEGSLKQAPSRPALGVRLLLWVTGGGLGVFRMKKKNPKNE